MKAIQVPTDRYTDKQMWHIHKREYYSALKKKKDIMIHSTIWMNFRDILLTEINQSQKDNDCLILLI